MKMDFDRSLDLPVPAGRAWAFLERIEAVAACLPGARITERVDATHYRGTVSVRLGPAALTFKGDAEIQSMDAMAREIRLVGKGIDGGGSSAADLHLVAHLTETGPASCRLAGRVEAGLNGKAAAFGGRVMTSAADQLIKQFYANLLLAVQEPPETVATVAAAPKPTSLNGLSLLWAMLKSLIGGLFAGKRPAAP